ncbi:MAG: hypothetical protein OPY03_05000 [Nitrosopumilus sp.]|nr:hypothetical protein [Nitrosopumilus sp.]
MKVDNRSIHAEHSICEFCGKSMILNYIRRRYCNNTCARRSINFKSILIVPRKLRLRNLQKNHDRFVKYALEQTGQPMQYYRKWEKYLRDNTMPEAISEFIRTSTPLPKPNHEGFGLPLVIIAKRENLIHV